MTLKFKPWGAALIHYYTHQIKPRQVNSALADIDPSLRPLKKDIINLSHGNGFTMAVVPNVRPKTGDPAARFMCWTDGKPEPKIKPVLEMAARLINRIHADKL